MKGFFTEMPKLYCARCGHVATVHGNGDAKAALEVACINMDCEQFGVRFGYNPSVVELEEFKRE